MTGFVARKCDYVNMELTSEQGNHNILTIKSVKKSNGVCESDGGGAGTPVPSPSASKNALPHRNQGYIPTVSFLFGDFIPGCGE